MPVVLETPSLWHRGHVHVCGHAWLLMWVVGIWTPVFMIAQYVFSPLSVPGWFQHITNISSLSVNFFSSFLRRVFNFNTSVSLILPLWDMHFMSSWIASISWHLEDNLHYPLKALPLTFKLWDAERRVCFPFLYLLRWNVCSSLPPPYPLPHPHPVFVATLTM